KSRGAPRRAGRSPAADAAGCAASIALKIAISTGGGDAPGLNAVIRGAVLASLHRGWECVGIRRGYGGLLGEDRVVPLDANAVRGITHLGGTILGTTNRGDPFRWPTSRSGGASVERDRSDELVAAFRTLEIDALIAIGGDGSLRIAQRLFREKGIAVVGVPKTIDNDVGGTVATFGFDTAVQTATAASWWRRKGQRPRVGPYRSSTRCTSVWAASPTRSRTRSRE